MHLPAIHHANTQEYINLQHGVQIFLLMSGIPDLILKFQWAKRCCWYAGVYGNCNQLSLMKCKNPSIASLHSSHKTEDKRRRVGMKVVQMEERRKTFLLLLPSPHLLLPLYVCNAIYTLSLLKPFTQILYCHKSYSIHPFILLLTLVFWMDRVAWSCTIFKCWQNYFDV